MIAANYTTNLYCDCAECTEGKWASPDFGEYVGKSWSECASDARKDGWRISKDRRRSYAPAHKIKRGVNANDTDK